MNQRDVNILKIEVALELCKKFLETSPYLCLCGAGVKQEDCEWHNLLDETAYALSQVDYAPDWFNKMNDVAKGVGHYPLGNQFDNQ